MASVLKLLVSTTTCNILAWEQALRFASRRSAQGVALIGADLEVLAWQT
jgi:hypothetical protein